MLDSFVASGNLKAVLKHPDAGPVLPQLAAIIEQGDITRSDRLGMSSDLQAGQEVSASSLRKGRLQKLDDTLWTELRNIEDDLKEVFGTDEWKTPSQVYIHQNIMIQGRSYSSHPKSPARFVFCQSEDDYWPGFIRQIFSTSDAESEGGDSTIRYFIVIDGFEPARSQLEDPFQDYPDFGARLWSSSTYSLPFIIPVTPDLQICHAIFRKWDEQNNVLKPLTRVCVTFGTYAYDNILVAQNLSPTLALE